MTPRKLTRVKNKFLKCISLLFLTCFFFTCGKKSDPITVVNNNEIKATVQLSSGATVNITGKGENAVIGCAPSYYTYIEGTDENNTAVYINVSSSVSGSNCVTYPGAYRFYCEYRQNIKSTNTPIYTNLGPNLRDTITFTVCTVTNIEGRFKAKCWNGPDTVLVSGTFKADKIK